MDTPPPITPPEPTPLSGATPPTPYAAPSIPAAAPTIGSVAAAPPPPWSRRRRAVLITGIVAASLGLLGGLVGGIVVLVSAIAEASDEFGPMFEGLQPPSELLPVADGDPGPATAVSPAECPDLCFSAASVQYAVIDASAFAALGLTDVVEEWGDYADSSVQAEFGYSASGWVDGEGSPDECFVTYLSGPVAIGIDDRPGVIADTIHWIGVRQDSTGFNSIGSSVRVSADSASATDHMTTLKSLVSGCEQYELGSGAEYWTARVTPAPALNLPDDVAAVGWVEDSPFGRFYTIDLQRSNLIVRITGFTDGSFTEEQFRSLVEDHAVQLSEIEPPAQTSR